MNEYLKTEKLTVEEKRLLFSMKNRRVNVKTNFENNLSNLSCKLCKMNGENECEIHILECEKIKSKNNMQEQMKDIFVTIEKQIVVIKVWKRLSRYGF